eukprot:1429410-Lingulodinium_polyedra.AAC.1
MARGPSALIWELSQSITRARPAGSPADASRPACVTVIPRAAIWVASQRRLLCGLEHLAIQGYPVDSFKSISR